MGSYPPNRKLRQARQDAGLSQEEFAERLGAHMQQKMSCNVAPSGNLIGMWERGEVRPGRLYRRGLADFTGLSEADLGIGPGLPFTGKRAARHAVVISPPDGPGSTRGNIVVREREREDGDDPVRRREMLAGAAALVGTAVLPGQAPARRIASRGEGGAVLEDVLYGKTEAAPVPLPRLRAMRPGDFPTPEREGRYWVDVARAFHQWGKAESCNAALLAAERAAPAEVRYRPPVHRMAEELLRRPGTPMPGAGVRPKNRRP